VPGEETDRAEFSDLSAERLHDQQRSRRDGGRPSVRHCLGACDARASDRDRHEAHARAPALGVGNRDSEEIEMKFEALRGWTSDQRSVVIASFLGWTLDAFDFFLLVFVLKDIAQEFNTQISEVTFAILLTLAMRPIGAFLFGRAADRWGRRPTLMVDVLLYSFIEFASGFSPNLTVLLVLRALYGVAMGGEWGVGASLTMESIPPHARGFVSGLLQSGYPTGYFVASIVYGLLFPIIGWRGMFMVGVLPALLVLYIRRRVPESPSWDRAAAARSNTLSILRSHWRLGVYAVVLMTAFNFFSHGTQDLYPTFLQVEHGLSPHAVGTIAAIYNVGAIIGGIVSGSLSEWIGRRRVIVIAALLSLPVLPLWAFSDSPALLALGAFLMQVMVQGAWGVIPVHLNELSPDEARGTFPGFVYQLGNLLASANATIQAGIAAHFGGNYGLALALVASSVAIIIAVLTSLGVEAKGVAFGTVRRLRTAT
jgi:MFS transporter, SHS family, lactate transporter